MVISLPFLFQCPERLRRWLSSKSMIGCLAKPRWGAGAARNKKNGVNLVTSPRQSRGKISILRPVSCQLGRDLRLLLQTPLQANTVLQHALRSLSRNIFAPTRTLVRNLLSLESNSNLFCLSFGERVSPLLSYRREPIRQSLFRCRNWQAVLSR